MTSNSIFTLERPGAMSKVAAQETLTGLEHAIQLHSAGLLEQAEAEYRQVLVGQPHSIDALYFLGCLLSEQGKADQSAKYLQQAAKQAPQSADIHAALGDLYFACGRFDRAVESYRQAITWRPEFAAVHYNLGNTFGMLERVPEAIVSYRRALSLAPNFMPAHYNLGNLLHGRGQFEGAILCFERAIGLEPDFAPAQEKRSVAQAALEQERAQRAQAHYEAGVTLQMQGQLQQAAQQYRLALELNPLFSEAHNNLGTVLWKSNNDASAAAHCHAQAVKCDPHNNEARINYGIMLYGLARHQEAKEMFLSAHAEPTGSLAARKTLATFLHAYGAYQAREIELRRIIAAYPEEVTAYKELSDALAFQCRYEEAEAVARQTLTRFPDAPESHVALAVLLLAAGDYEQGWREYTWTAPNALLYHPFAAPLWDGSPLEGKRILVYLRAGFGDTIQMIRYLPLLKAQGAWVALECRPELARLLQGCDSIDVVIARDLDTGATTLVPEVDYQILLNHLPARFETRLDTIPPCFPYLRVPVEVQARWRQRLAAWIGFKVGIVWNCSDGSSRCCPLTRFAALASVPNVVLFSLQKDNGASKFAAYIEAGGSADTIIDLAPEIGDFVDTAAAIQQLDLIISVDTSVAHLAGALGRSVWTLLPHGTDWRWMRDRTDTPWYPSMRLFRQPRAGDWNSVMENVRTALHDLL